MPLDNRPVLLGKKDLSFFAGSGPAALHFPFEHWTVPHCWEKLGWCLQGQAEVGLSYNWTIHAPGTKRSTAHRARLNQAWQ